MFLGAHITIAEGIDKSPEIGKNIGCEAIQIFTKNQLQWTGKPINKSVATNFKENLARFQMKVVAHGTYLTNLCSNKKDVLKKSKETFIDEIKRCELLGIPYLIFHPGAHLGEGEEKGLKMIAENLNFAHSKTEKVVTLIENTAGQGTVLGSRFEQIGQIIEMVEEKRRVGVCIDTCHTFAAGYDIRTESSFDNVLKEIDKSFGLNKVKAFHLNEAKSELGSHLDRHANLTEGKIGNNCFKLLVRKFKDAIGILETPGGYPGYEKELRLLKSFR